MIKKAALMIATVVIIIGMFASLGISWVCALGSSAAICGPGGMALVGGFITCVVVAGACFVAWNLWSSYD